MTLPMAAALCREAVAHTERAAALLDAPDLHDISSEQYRESLIAAFGHLEQARHKRTQAQVAIVDALREDEATWREIGDLLGITGSAAWQRFGPEAASRHDQG